MLTETDDIDFSVLRLAVKQFENINETTDSVEIIESTIIEEL